MNRALLSPHKDVAEGFDELDQGYFIRRFTLVNRLSIPDHDVYCVAHQQGHKIVVKQFFLDPKHQSLIPILGNQDQRLRQSHKFTG